MLKVQWWGKHLLSFILVLTVQKETALKSLLKWKDRLIYPVLIIFTRTLWNNFCCHKQQVRGLKYRGKKLRISETNDFWTLTEFDYWSKEPQYQSSQAKDNGCIRCVCKLFKDKVTLMFPGQVRVTNQLGASPYQQTAHGCSVSPDPACPPGRNSLQFSSKSLQRY